MRIAMVVNPTSGKRRGDRIARTAQQRLTDAGHEVVVIDRRDVDARVDEFQLVTVVGGDGALHDVLPALIGRDVTVAMIPAGTGNDVARHVGVARPEAAITAILAGHTRDVDVIDVGEGRYVATVVASGFDSKVNERAESLTWPRGNMRYNRAIVAELREFEPLTFTLTIDGRTVERSAMLVAVANMPSFGGGIRIAEGAADDDGQLDVIVIHPVSKWKLVRVFPRLYRGTHVTLPEFERIPAREVTWESAGIVGYGDGERLGSLPITARVVPHALRLVVGG